ncbi:MAG: zf-HC2 domain-containing protein [Candidatus Aureabacteria bacterium]|nr:zf-HC2 domain-containing protein [Candidatus Auribacterota bacterium]
MIRQPDDPRKGKESWERFRRGVSPRRDGHCPDAIDLAAYADGRASRRKVREVEEHLFACRVCLEALRDLRSLVVEEFGDIPADIAARAKGLVREPVPARGLSWTWLPALTLRSAPVWAASALLVLAAGTAGYFLGQGSAAEGGAGIPSNYMAPGFSLTGADETAGSHASSSLFTGGVL